MYARKLLSLVSTAVFAVVMLAGCGGSNFSSAAAKAANKAQSTVVFETDARLTNSLQDALEASADPTAIRQAMVEDDNMDELLKSGYRLDVLTVGGSDGDAAADALAEYIKTIVSGREKEGYISLVKADNGSFYAAILTYRNGGSGGGSGSGGGTTGGGSGEQGGSGEGGGNPGGTTDPDNPGSGDIGDENTEYTVTINVEGDKAGGYVNSPNSTTINQSFSFTVTTNEGYEATVTVNGEELTGDGEYTLSGVTGDTTVTVTFAKKVYSVKVSMAGGNGEYYLPSSTVAYGESVTLTVTPHDGYKATVAATMGGEAVHPTVDGVDGSEYTISDVKGDVVFNLTFTETPKTITWKDTEITPAQMSVDYGDKFFAGSLTVYAVYTDGTNEFKGEVNSFNYKSEILDDQDRFTESGTLTITYNDKFGEERTATVEVTVNPKDPVATSYLKVTPKDPSKVYTKGQKIPKDDLKVEAEYRDALGNVTYKVLDEEQFEITSNPLDKVGDKVPVTVTATVDGVECKGSTTVKVEKDTHKITIKVVGNGQVRYGGYAITSNKKGEFDVEDSVTIYVAASQGYKISSVTSDKHGDLTSVNNGSYTLSNITEDDTITVTFEEAVPTVTAIEINDDAWGFENYYYKCNENFKPDGLKITVKYDNRKPAILTVGKDLNATKLVWDVEECEYLQKHKHNGVQGWYKVTIKITYAEKSDYVTIYLRCDKNGDNGNGKCHFCVNWDGVNETQNHNGKPPHGVHGGK